MKPQEFIDKWLGWAKNKEEINDEILADLDAMNKALSIPIVSKSFALGENVKVDRCIHGHEFELGQVVTIVEYEPSKTTSWLCSDGRNQWWLSENEASVC